MTAKRFILNEGVANFSDTVTDKVYSEYNLDEIVELLNELHEENKELKKQVRLLNIEDERWTKASEKDKETIDRLNKKNNELYILVETLKEQNQKFKARLNDLGVEYL